MAFKVGYYTTCSPFYGSKLAMWRHHDATFKRLCDEENVEFHVLLPVVGGQSHVDKLYQGNKGVLYPTLRDMNFTFHADMDDNIELDALYLDDIHTYFKITIGERTYLPEEQDAYLRRLIERMIAENKPIIFSDTDGFCTEILEDNKAEMMDLFNDYKGYHKLKVTSPFDNPIHDNFYLIPFEVDPATFQEIKPLSEREFLLRYVGNEYYREHFLPIFDKLSKVGNVRVNGAGWGKYHSQCPDVDWSVKITMTPDGVNKVYGDSAVGLTGRSSYNAKKGQEIYLYRWKEYLAAGTLIIPENLPSYTSKLPDGSLTVDDILTWSDNKLASYFDMSDEDYKDLVEKQREKAVEFFGVDKWVPVFKEMFEI